MSAKVYTFDRWNLDCGRGVLTSETGEITLRPKTFDVLRVLVENSGRLVSRDEMLAAVWPGLTVTEESLTKCISELRNALGDAGLRVIKTVPKRGYLLNAVVASASDVTVPTSSASVLGPSVAVLPFTNLSGDPSQEYLSDGITEDIINGLSYFSDVSVIARNSAFSYKGRAVDVREVGRQLDAHYILEGSVRQFGDRIRITAQLVDASSGLRRWGERFDRPAGDVFAIQDEITQAIVRIAVAHVSNAERERASSKPSGSWTAYDLTLQGDQAQRLLEQTWEPKYLYEARNRFIEALKADKDNAKICAKLAHTYVRAYADPGSPDLNNRKDLENGFELSRRAVSLDPNLPLARAQLGWAYFWLGEPDAAIDEFEKALALNCNFADYRFAVVLAFAGEPERALGVLQTQIRLDPFHPAQLHAVRGYALYMLERYAEALSSLRECMRRGRHLPGQLFLAAALVRLGQLAQAKEVIADVLAKVPNLTRARWPLSSAYRNRSDADHLFDALREAAFP